MATATSKPVYKCGSCGEVTTKKGHLCHPVKLDKAYECEYCGSTASDARHVCSPKLVDIKYFCENCGRVATSRSLLCKPSQVKKALPKPRAAAKKPAAKSRASAK